MELFAKRMTWELDNEEGLSCLFFELEDGYFTLSRKTGAEALRLEMNDPANGQLIDPDCFEYALDNTRFRLNIVRNNRKVLRYLEEHHINTELYGEIVLHYETAYPYHYIRLIVTGISDTKKALVFLKQHFGDSSFQQTKDRLKELPLLIYSGLDTGTAPLENSLDRWGLMYEKQQISLEKFLEDQAYIRNL